MFEDTVVGETLTLDEIPDDEPICVMELVRTGPLPDALIVGATTTGVEAD